MGLNTRCRELGTERKMQCLPEDATPGMGERTVSSHPCVLFGATIRLLTVHVLVDAAHPQVFFRFSPRSPLSPMTECHAGERGLYRP